MHITLVTHYYAPEVGAPQRRWGALVPRFVAAGHRVTVLAPPPHYPSGDTEGQPPELRPGATTTGEHGETIHRVRFRPHTARLPSRVKDQAVAAVDSTVQGTRRLGRDRPDVVIATVPGIPSIGAGVALQHLLHAPLVVEMRDAWPDLIEPSGMLGGSARRGWRGLVTNGVHRAMTRAQRRAAAVVTTTDAFADILRERGAKRVHVIRNGAYLDEVPWLGPREEDGDTLRVLYLGTVGRSQGLDTAVRAAGLLHERGSTIQLRIVGPGADYPRLVKLAWQTGAPVDLQGPVPRGDVFDQYAWADSLLVSLRGWEPLRWTVPSKLYEMMATGRHVTAVMAGEAAEIVSGTAAGDVSPPEDPVALANLWEAVAANRSRLRLGPGGRAWALENSDYDRLAEAYLRVLDEVRR